MEQSKFRKTVLSDHEGDSGGEDDQYSPFNSKAEWNRASNDGYHIPNIPPPLIRPQKKQSHTGLEALLASCKKDDMGAALTTGSAAVTKSAGGKLRKSKSGGGETRSMGGVKGGEVLALDKLGDTATKMKDVVKNIVKDVKEDANKDVEPDVMEVEMSLKLDDLFDDGSDDMKEEGMEKSIE